MTCCALVFAGVARADEDVEFYDTLNANQVALGDTVTLTIQLSGSQQAMNAEIELPPLPDFEVLSQHRSSSMRMSFAGGQAQVVRSRVLTLILQPKKTGNLDIPPAKVTLGGRTHKTAELTLKVTPADPSHRKPQARRQPDPDPMQQFFGGNPFAGMPDSDDDQDPFAQLFGNGADNAPPRDSDLFLRTTVDKKQAYLGEQVTFTLYLFSRLDVARVDNPKLPKLDAFWSEEIESPNNITGDVKTVNGVPYRVYMLKRRALFPIKAGKQLIDPVEVDVVTGLSLFGNGRSVHRASPPVELEVKPLPAGAPPGFSASDVGQWRLGMITNPPAANPVPATVGQPVTVDLIVDGFGNLRNLTVPKLPPVRGLHVYDPTTTDKVQVSKGRFGGRRTLEFVVMPEQTGTLEIPSVSLPYFNPVTGTYETATTQPVRLEVSAGTGVASAATGGQNPNAGQNVLGANLARPIHTRATIGEAAAPLWARGFFVPVMLLPFGLLLGGAVVSGVRRSAGREDPGKRVKSAQSRARKRFKSADALLEQGDSPAYYGAVTKALNDYLTDKLGLSAHGLTREELARRMAEAGAKPESVQQTAAVLDACDMGRFAPGSTQGRRDVLEQAVACVDALESQRLRQVGARA